MRLRLAAFGTGLLLVACSGDDTMSATRDAQPPGSGQGGTAGTGGAGEAGSPPDGGGSGGASAGRGGTGGGVSSGSPDAGPDGGGDVSVQLITHGKDGCVITRDGTPQCWDTLGSPTGSPFAGVFVSVYGGPADQFRRVCMRDGAGDFTCDGAPRPPQQVRVSEMAVGNKISCGLQADQTIVCWDAQGTVSAADLPVPSGAFGQISAGTDVFCGLRPDGTVACWGADAAQYSVPEGARFVQLSVGLRLACGVTAAGGVACWGPLSGELVLPPPTSGARSVHLGFGGGCALREDGRAECFGNVPSPNEEPPGHLFRELAAGDATTCGIATDDLVWCWKFGVSEQMADQAGNPLLAKDP